jgi:ABC-2 type transport system permease protein
MSAVYILWLRELRRYVRSRAQIVASLGQPILYLVALGFGLGPVFQKAGQGSYVQFVAPGVIAMTVLFSSVFSGIGVLWDRQFGFLKETLVAPVPRIQIMLGRTLGAATVAMLQGLLVVIVCFIAGFRVANFATVPLALVFMALIACVFAALGSAIGSALENMQGFQLVMNFLVMPIFFLSGALYPLNGLPRAFSIVTSIDPLTYGIDGLRTALIGVRHFGFAVDGIVMVGVAIVFLLIASRLFSKIQI